MPYFLVDGSNVFDRFNPPKFHLVQFSDGQAPQEDPTTPLDPRLAAWVDTAVVPLYPRVTDLFGADKPFTVLLRPDNYIATIWPGLDVTPAQQWLANIITSPAPELKPHLAANAWLLRPKPVTLLPPPTGPTLSPDQFLGSLRPIQGKAPTHTGGVVGRSRRNNRKRGATFLWAESNDRRCDT